MGKFDALAEALGLAVKKYGDDAVKILEKVDSPELATSLKGEARGDYLKALDEVYGEQAKRAKDMGFKDKIWYHGTNQPINQFSKQALGLNTSANSAKQGFFFTNSPDVAEGYATVASELGRNKYDILANKKYLEYSNALESLPKNPSAAQENEVSNLWKDYKSIKEEAKLASSSPKYKNKYVEKTYLKTNNPEIIDYEGVPRGAEDIWSDKLKQAKTQGKDSFIAKNTFDNILTDSDMVKKNYNPHDIAAVFEPNQIRSIDAAFDPRFKDSSLLMAGALAGNIPNDIEISPLPILKKASEYYEGLKEKLAQPLAEQLNIGKDPRDEENIKNIISTAGDPLNYVPGAAGAGLGLIQALSSSLPKSPEEQALDKIKQQRISP